LFDAIICDVPCSGDGTIRKDPHILPGWTPKTSNALHLLQVQILSRAIQCVKVGGVVCYSTCSLNPVEDEAVVCAVLKKYDYVELQDGPIMKGFCGQRGVSYWFVGDYDEHAYSTNDDDEPRLRWYDSFTAAVEGNMASACETMWPPKDLSSGLEKCTRLHPQDHDSGGFFVAVLQRTG
jgi:16S rRNA C967 or C1407 C5-methylase (RsmB/RsmF family)